MKFLYGSPPLWETIRPFMPEATEHERVGGALALVLESVEQAFANHEFLEARDREMARPIALFEDVRWPTEWGLRGLAQEAGKGLLPLRMEQSLLETNYALLINEGFYCVKHADHLTDEQSLALAEMVDIVTEHEDDDGFVDFVNGLPSPFVLDVVRQAREIHERRGRALPLT